MSEEPKQGRLTITQVAMLVMSLALLVVIPIKIVQMVQVDCGGSVHLFSQSGAERVLFVGNSHTYTNNLPRMVASLAKEDEVGGPICAAAMAFPGYELSQHGASWRVRRAIGGKSLRRYDLVVVQGQSLEPLFYPEGYVEWIQWFAAMAEQAEMEFVLYPIWAWEKDHLIYQELEHQGPEEATARIEEVAQIAIGGTSARSAPVARAWEMARHQMPKTSFHHRDGYHAALHGTYLSALVLYGTIRQRQIGSAAWHPPEVTEAEAAQLIEIANQVLMQREPELSER